MHGQLAGLVNKPHHKDEDDKESKEALVATSRAFCRAAVDGCFLEPAWVYSAFSPPGAFMLWLR